MRRRWLAALAVPLALLGLMGGAGYFNADPLIQVPATAAPTAARSGIAAVYMSGDAGYELGMGRRIGNRLASDGIPVVAINSLAYFRQHRSPQQVARLIARAMREAMQAGQANQVVLIGHSLGADTMQASLSLLAPELRPRVRTVVLIVPTSEVHFKVSIPEMLGWTPGDLPALPSLRRLTWVPTTCIYGMAEANSPCRALRQANARSVGLPGGHALKWDIDAVHRTILEAIDHPPAARITNH